VDRGAGGSVNRFTSELFELPDEVDASSVQPIELRKINAHLLHSGQDLSGYDVLPVARIRRASDGATLELDPSFIPPLLDCSAWPALRSQILSPISDLLLRASEQAGQAIADAGKTLQPSTPLQFQRLLLLQAVNPAASILRVMTNSRGIHPQTAYLELSRLAGSLDLFHPQRSVQDTRPYDHENLGPIFLQLKQRVVTALTLFDNKPYFQKFLVGNDLGMQTAIDQDASGHTQWFIGINKGKVPLETLHQLLSPRHLDWKVGSVQQVEWLFTQRAPGVELDPVSELPSVLPRSNEWAYFKVNTSSDAWTDVMATKSLGIRLKDSLIANRGELPGSKHLVVQHASQPLTLQIALFGVS
jgi:type VI secretion system protein ImpJ